MRIIITLLLSLSLGLVACQQEIHRGSENNNDQSSATTKPQNSDAISAETQSAKSEESAVNSKSTNDAAEPKPILDLATLGAGCFWCIEAVLLQIDGVEAVKSGYMGGHIRNPTYEQICSKKTGHIEVVEVEFDPKVLSYEQLLAWFWKLHDPTSWDKQGNDSGPQYRSAVFYHSEEQRLAVEASILAEQKNHRLPIVTEVRKLELFYSAEAYHQDYYERNKQQGYCRFVIAPKLDKLGLKK